MPRTFDDTTIVHNSLPDHAPAVDPAVLRRALRFGQKARDRHPHGRFRELEPELRTGWEAKGTGADWDHVSAAVRVGFEQGELDE